MPMRPHLSGTWKKFQCRNTARYRWFLTWRHALLSYFLAKKCAKYKFQNCCYCGIWNFALLHHARCKKSITTKAFTRNFVRIWQSAPANSGPLPETYRSSHRTKGTKAVAKNKTASMLFTLCTFGGCDLHSFLSHIRTQIKGCFSCRPLSQCFTKHTGVVCSLDRQGAVSFWRLLYSLPQLPYKGMLTNAGLAKILNKITIEFSALKGWHTVHLAHFFSWKNSSHLTEGFMPKG